MLRVAFVSDTPPRNIGGVERFNHSLAEFLTKRNISADIYDQSCLSPVAMKWYERMGLEMPLRSKRLGLEAWRRIAGRPVNVLIQNGISGWNLRQLTELPRIVIHHGTWRGSTSFRLPEGSRWRTSLARYVLTNRMLGGLERYAATGATSVAVSGAVAEELMRDYGGVRSVVIPNGIDISHFSRQDRLKCRMRYGLGPDDFIACFTGRVEIGKGSDVMLALAQQAMRERPDMKFFVATDAAPQGWPPNVVFAENVGYEAMPSIYSAADVFLFPTRYEGCSYSLLEAMACELPVLAGRVGYAKDLYRDLPDLALFLPDQAVPELYWEGLKRLVADRELGRRLGSAGAEYVRRYNSMDAMADSYAQLIRQLAGGTGAP